MTKRGRGRPPLPEEIRRSVKVSVHFTPSEGAKLARDALEAGMPVSSWVRLQTLRSSK